MHYLIQPFCRDGQVWLAFPRFERGAHHTESLRQHTVDVGHAADLAIQIMALEAQEVADGQ